MPTWLAAYVVAALAIYAVPHQVIVERVVLPALEGMHPRHVDEATKASMADGVATSLRSAALALCAIGLLAHAAVHAVGEARAGLRDER